MQLTSLRTFHKWLSLACVLLWILQAASGLVIAFRADIDDFLIGNEAVETDAVALAGAIEALQNEGADISSIWISGGRNGQYDAYLTRDGKSQTVRIDGTGNRVRERSDAALFSQGALFETVTQFHKSLMLGAAGYLFLFVSGLLLASNIILALVMGWPKRRRLAKLLKAKGLPPGTSLSGWHWQIGLWGALPALIVVLAGTALNQADVVDDILSVEEAAPENAPTQIASPVGLVSAIETALAEFPGSTLISISLPSDSRQWYRFRLKAPGEMPRLYGATRVYVGLDGDVLLTHDATNSAANVRLSEALYPLHTGQIGGLVGRLVNFAVGIWLLVMAFLGIRLWLARRAAAHSKRSFSAH
jgi:uncharacterized iron-regulated membrane protein